MAEFSYSSDIAPMQRNYFADVAASRGLSEREKSMLTSQYTAKVKTGLAEQIDLADKMIKTQNNELVFREQQLKLKQATEAAKLEREALSVIPDVTKQLTGIMGDTSLDDSTRANKIAELKFQYAKPATYSPEMKSIFSAAEGTVESRKANMDRSNALAYTLIQSGQGDAAKKILEGRTDPLAGQYMVAADAVSAAKKQESESKSALKEQEFARGMDKETRAAQTEMLKDYMGTIRRLEPPKASADTLEIGTLGGTPKTPAIPSATPPKYAKEDRAELEEIVRSLNENVDEKRLLSAPDIDLYKAALESTTGTLKNLAGFKSQFNRDKFRTTPPPQ